MKATHALFLLFLGLSPLFTGCASLSQRVVMPGSYLKPPACEVKPGAGYELVTLKTKEGIQVLAQFGTAFDEVGAPRATPAGRPTVIFFYGNRMCIAGSRDMFDAFRRMGANVLIPEYPGYGMSDGKPSESGCYAVANAAYAYLRSRDGIDDGRIVAAGLSLGGGVAVDLASRESLAGLVLIVPFTNTRDVGMDTMPWYLRWAVPTLSRHALFDNLGKIDRVKCPILIISGSRDQLSSAKRSQQLAAAATAKVKLVVVEAEHDSAWYKGLGEIGDWLKTDMKTGR